jgi:Fic family protein
MMQLKYPELRLVSPPFDSNLTGLILDLNHMRQKTLGGTTPSYIFFQIKNIFHIIESIGSARIEGNHTTLVEYIDAKITPSPSTETEQIIEIRNMESALDFIDKNIDDTSINRIFLSELHKQVVAELTAEGSKRPGEYRQEKIRIAGAKLSPPDYTQVNLFMEELFDFINHDDPPQFDLLKTAIAHHRFAWIHPFDNGNGRTVRLLTYAMLVKQGFKVRLGRIINPTAVFCSDRDKYYKKLAKADIGDDEGILSWCEYVLAGLKTEIDKVDRLANYNYLLEKVLRPTIHFSLDRKHITDIEAKILNVAIEKKEGFKNADLRKVFPKRVPADISRLIRSLKENRMLAALPGNKRKYTINFDNNYLLRGVLFALENEGFLPVHEDFR